MVSQEEPRGEIVIRDIRREDGEGSSRVVCAVDIVEDGRMETREAFFSVPAEYSEFLVHERCDAFAIVLLKYALDNGYDLRSEVPMSEDLYYNVSEHLVPPMVKNGRYRISFSSVTAPPLPGGSSVGTGASCGVDSMHAIRKYSDYPLEEYRLTHLCINNVGAFDRVYDLTGVDEARAKIYARARLAAEEAGLPLIETDSDIYAAFPMNYLFSHDFYSAFAVFCLRKLWRIYYYASEGVDYITGFSVKDHRHSDSAAYELLLFDCLSTPSFRIYSEGATLTRFEKLKDLVDYPLARKHLFSCNFSGDNCSRCDKCARNMLALDSLGRLDDFSEVYDVPFYRSHRARFIWYMYIKRADHYFEPIFESFEEGSDDEFQRIVEIGRLVRKFDALWERGDRRSDRRAVGLMAPYESEEVHAAMRMAKAYISGRGVQRDEEKWRACMDFAADYYRKEIEDGFESSRLRLFDILWDLNDPDCNEEMFSVIIPLVEAKKPSACARMARMCMEGRIVDKDPDAAVEWMRDAASLSPSKYLAEFCEILLSTDSEENHREAMRLCKERYGLVRNPSYCALVSGMYRDGKGVEKDMDAAVEWMAQAYRKDPAKYFQDYCSLLLSTGNDRYYNDAMNLCLRLYREQGSPLACELISSMYRDGKGVLRDMDAAIEWMRKAVDKDRFKFVHKYCNLLLSAADPKYHLEAMDICRRYLDNGGSPAFCAIIARMYRDGKGVEKDPEQAVEWMRKAVEWRPYRYLIEYAELVLDSGVEQAYPEVLERCLARYGEVGAPVYARLISTMYRDGKGVEKDPEQAAEWMGRAVFAKPLGDVSAYCSYMASMGEGYARKAVEACEEYYSRKKSPAVCAAIAGMYRDGEGMPSDLEKATEWMRRAAELDPAKHYEGYCRLLMESEDPGVRARAAEECRRMHAETGSPVLARLLSEMYRDGKGVEQDSDRAVEWMRKAVRADPKDYMADYCDLLMGIDDEVSYKEAMARCLELYDDTGLPVYSKFISIMYRDGKGVEQDIDKAVEWMRKAAEADPAGYSGELCELLLSTDRPDLHEEAFRICSERYEASGSLDLCIHTARMYRDGKGVEQDIDKAVEWMRKAADWMPQKHLKEFAELLLSTGSRDSYREAYDRCSARYAESGSPVYAKLISQMHRDGKGAPRSFASAMEWMRKAAEKNPREYGSDYCDLLLSTDDASNHAEAFRLCTETLARDDAPALYIQMGRMYRDGKGTEKDIGKAVEWMRKATDWKVHRHLKEFAELLLSTGSEEDAEEAMRRCVERFEESGSPVYAKLIAGMYRDGKGVEKDLDKALEWIGKISDQESEEGRTAYYEFLVSTDRPDLHEGLLEECRARYEAGGPSIYCVLISRMYRDGKGVEKDMDKAVEWMERAYMDDPKAWYSEFNALLSMRGQGIARFPSFSRTRPSSTAISSALPTTAVTLTPALL